MHAPSDAIVYLIGNKSDSESTREVTFDRALQFAQHNSIQKCFETSALTGHNVEEIFTCAAKDTYYREVESQEN